MARPACSTETVELGVKIPTNVEARSRHAVPRGFCGDELDAIDTQTCISFGRKGARPMSDDSMIIGKPRCFWSIAAASWACEAG